MAASYTYKTYLKRKDTGANTTFYLKAILTETSSQTEKPITFNFDIRLGVESKYYHYKLNNYVQAYWKGNLVGGSTTSTCGEIILGQCGGSSGNPSCGYHSGTETFPTEKSICSGSFTSSDGKEGIFQAKFQLTAAIPSNEVQTEYTATISETVRVIKGTFDNCTSKNLTGWAFVPYQSAPPLKLLARVYNSSGIVLGTYEIPRTDSRTDVVEAYGTSMCAQSTCGYNYSWDLAALCGRGILTVKMFYSYNDGTWFQLGSTKTVDTRLDMSVYNGSAWKSGPAYVYNGSEWKPAKRVWVYNGSSWV